MTRPIEATSLPIENGQSSKSMAFKNPIAVGP